MGLFILSNNIILPYRGWHISQSKTTSKHQLIIHHFSTWTRSLMYLRQRWCPWESYRRIHEAMFCLGKKKDRTRRIRSFDLGNRKQKSYYGFYFKIHSQGVEYSTNSCLLPLTTRDRYRCVQIDLQLFLRLFIWKKV